MTEKEIPSAAFAIERAVDALPFVPPTRGRRSALATVFWQAAKKVTGLKMPKAAKRALRDAYLARVKLLRAPGEFDFDAYDKTAGRKQAFMIEWWLHAAECQKLYVGKPEL